jgi:hypothetical protein
VRAHLIAVKKFFACLLFELSRTALKQLFNSKPMVDQDLVMAQIGALNCLILNFSLKN